MKDRRDEDGGQDGNLDMIIEKQRELRAVVKALGAQVNMNVVAERRKEMFMTMPMDDDVDFLVNAGGGGAGGERRGEKLPGQAGGGGQGGRQAGGQGGGQVPGRQEDRQDTVVNTGRKYNMC